MDILEALRSLNPDDDTQWTGDGLPVIAIVKKLADESPFPVTRKSITEAAPALNRETFGDVFSPDEVAGPTPPEEGDSEEPPETVDNSVPPENETEVQRTDRLTALKGELEAQRDEVRQRIIDGKVEEQSLTDHLDLVLLAMVNEDPNEPQHIRDTKKRMAHLNKQVEIRAATNQRSELDRSLAARGKNVRPLMTGKR